MFSFKYGDGIEGLQVFYEQPENSVDVLFLGSSRVFENVNTGFLWDEWGMASFDLAGSVQPFWNTYYYLQEALKTQHPRVIVLDVYCATMEEEYSDQSRIAKNTFGMKESIDKLRAKRVSSPDDDLVEYVLEFPQYHARYADLTSQDFLDHKGMKDRTAWKGFGINFSIGSLPKNIDVSGVTERAPLQEKVRVYLERIIDLAQSNGIPLVLVCAPYGISAEDQKKYNTVADIANESGIPFLNYNLMLEEAGIDFTGELSDLAADTSHLNHRGNVKYTRHLGNWLKSNFGIPDHRGDSRYSSWQISADDCRAQIADQGIKEAGVFSDWLKLVTSREDLTTILVVKNSGHTSNEGISEALSAINAGNLFSDAQAIAVLHGNVIQYSSTDTEYVWHEGVHGGELMAKCQEGNSLIQFASDVYQVQDQGITAFVYDSTVGNPVECVSWNAGALDSKIPVAAKQFS